ncbi:MAG: SpoIIE family protein phosphatase [Oscillibacter sp.]|nr:SpoIIE family protein phosphatase [Oscillibacter sp.]
MIGILTTGILTYVTETRLYERSVLKETETHAAQVVDEVKLAVAEFPANQWLIRYWYEHADTLDIEYDVQYSGRTRTALKCRAFSKRHPELDLRYLDGVQCRALPEEDQKLYAEIAYSWLITRIDQIKQAYKVAFLFCVITEEPYDSQFFLFSGADIGAVRGTNYEEVYPLGNTVTVSESQQEAMREATQKSSHLADAGDYLDYYARLYTFDGHKVLVGLTYDLSNLRADVRTQTRHGATLAILNQMLLSLICLALILVFVLRPLKRVQRSIRHYKESKNSAEVTEGLAAIRSRNEIGKLSEDVSEMVREIDSHVEKIRTITAEKERIGTELALATRIQASMLPSVFPPFPDRTEFDIYAGMDPAKEVGGDFYDFFLIDDDHLCVVVADVSGKGVPAALFMMAAKIILATNAMSGKSPARILADTNAAICANNTAEMFVTVWLGILEISTGKLTAANAGHEYPMLRKPNGAFEVVHDRHGFVIGGMDGVRYTDYEIMLEKGSGLFLYTDGLPEATDGQGTMFGEERALAALNAQSDASPNQILKNVRAAVDGFVKDAEQFDDLTMLCLEYRGS